MTPGWTRGVTVMRSPTCELCVKHCSEGFPWASSVLTLSLGGRLYFPFFQMRKLAQIVHRDINGRIWTQALWLQGLPPDCFSCLLHPGKICQSFPSSRAIPPASQWGCGSALPSSSVCGCGSLSAVFSLSTRMLDIC